MEEAASPGDVPSRTKCSLLTGTAGWMEGREEGGGRTPARHSGIIAGWFVGSVIQQTESLFGFLFIYHGIREVVSVKWDVTCAEWHKLCDAITLCM